MRDLQKEAIDHVRSGKNLFLTGPGGVGKSWVISEIKTPSTLLCAPTGIAAMNIGGMTCHSLFKLPIGIVTSSDQYTGISKLRELLQKTDRIIIDEAPMMRVDYFELIDAKLKLAMMNDKPFGGIQIAVVGDFFQLEPIVSTTDAEYFHDQYDSPFSFSSDKWDFTTIELTKVYRQDNEHQVALLNAIRRKEDHYVDALMEIQSIAQKYDGKEPQLHLCCYKDDAKWVNEFWYKRVNSKEYSFRANEEGTWSMNDRPVDYDMKLKVGIDVLLCANSVVGGYCNGDRGKIVDISPEGIIVQLSTNRTVKVEPFTWEKYRYNKVGSSISKDVIARYTQYPIKLGYGITIHSSQGMSLDKVALHTGKGCFGHGQLYVGLSRIRDLTNLSFVRPLKQSDVIIRQEVLNYYASTR
jgi:hypothetical protein